MLEEARAPLASLKNMKAEPEALAELFSKKNRTGSVCSAKTAQT